MVFCCKGEFRSKCRGWICEEGQGRFRSGQVRGVLRSMVSVSISRLRVYVSGRRPDPNESDSGLGGASGSQPGLECVTGQVVVGAGRLGQD